MSLSQILLIPGVGQMSFRDALSILSPYSPRLAFNFIDPTNSLFQGTTLTPVTTVTNPIGVVIDQTQGGLGNLGAELVTNGTFDSNVTGWTANNSAVITWVSGEAQINVPSNAADRMSQQLTTVANRVYCLTVGSSTGDLTVRVGTTAIGSEIIGSTLAPSGFKIVFRATGTATFISFGRSVAGIATVDNISVREIPGNHATASSDAKRPLWNSFTVNNRTVRGAVFDGSDDCLQVSGFDLSNTDEVCVIAGVRKLSDAATGFVCELGNGVSTNGTFGLTAPSSGGANSYRFSSEGTTGRAAGTGIFAAAPDSAHLVGIGDISAPLVRLWRNGSIVESVVLSQGTGNFTNATLNIGQRNNASLPFNGAISYLFILGAIPPDSILTRIYRGLAPQIGVSV